MKQAESDQIYEAMKAKGLPVEYLLYTDEGHGFARPPNSLDFCSRCALLPYSALIMVNLG